MSFDIGNNLTAVLIALIAAIPAIIAAYYARQASKISAKTDATVNPKPPDNTTLIG